MDHHPLLGRNGEGGGAVNAPPLYRVNVVILASLVVIAASTDWLLASGATTAAAMGIVIFGLPHGAFDLELLGGRLAGGRATDTPTADWHAPGVTTCLANDHARWRLLGTYVLLLLGAALLWATVPAVALILFLAMAAVHFGEDWHMLEAGLLRHMAGLSIVAVVTIARPGEVASLFAALTTPSFADALTRALVMVAPVVALVTLVGLLLAAQRGHLRWCTGYILALVIAAITPPVIGFAAFFVIVHSAIHLRSAHSALAAWPLSRFVGQGGLVAAGCFAVAWLANGSGLVIGPHLPVLVFKLLAVLTVPHLLLTHGWLPLAWVTGRSAAAAADVVQATRP